MRKFAHLAISCVCFIVITVSAALAHPPKELAIEWDPSGVLNVTVSHAVNDSSKHYVYQVSVFVDGTLVENREYTAQSSPEGHTDSFAIGAQQPGSVIRAEAFCVIMGSSSASINVQ